ncbi:MAG: zf-HC2 domain-containing protein [Ignavibacteriae bacterium]|nr:zf-HC2 domain-containing protein [Ignavibacteriota bacterium]
MRTHTRIKTLLYEYIRGELDEDEHKIVKDHLSVCQRCASDVTTLKAIIIELDKNLKMPHDERLPDFWNRFTQRIAERIDFEKQSSAEFTPSLKERLEEFFIIPQRKLIALSCLVIAILLIIAVLPWRVPLRQESTEKFITEQPVQLDTVAERMSKYFRKSKVLVVGLMNMKTDEGQALDLTPERNASEELIHEVRYLKTQPLDIQSAKLISQMERILIELANIEEEQDVPNIELVRSGIHQENLLFKIRMAEAIYGSERFMNVKN